MGGKALLFFLACICKVCKANAEESLLSRDLFEPGVLEYVGSRGNCSEGVPCQSLSSNSCLKEIRYTKYPDGTDSLEPQDEGMLESKTEMASVKLSEQGLCCSSVSGVRDEGELYNWLSGTDIKYLVRTSPPDQTVDITIALNGNASFYSHLCTHSYRVTSGKVFGMQVLDRTTPKLVERRPWLRALNPTHLLAIVVGGMVAAGFAIISICLAWERRKEVNEHNRIYAYVTMALRALDDAPLVSSCNAPMSRLASGSLNVSIS